MKSSAVSSTVKADMEEAQRLGLDGSPEFVVNGIRLSGAHSLKTFVQVLESEGNKLDG